jgi:hypothetical protein
MEKFRNKKIVILLGIPLIMFGVFFVYKSISGVSAEDRSWTQTDWRGGTSNLVATDTVTTFLDSENIDFSSDGEISIAKKSGWDLDGWGYREKITFDNTLELIGVEPEILVDFPVMIKLEDGENIDYSETNDDGSDIRFIDTDGTELSYEIELWDETGDSFVWVKVPQIDIGDQDYIYLYYGNSLASDSQNVNDVWSNGYDMVQHLKDSTTATVVDSTVNSFLGTKRVANYPSEIEGKIGKAQRFGTSDYINLGNILNPGSDPLTVEIWFRRQTSGGTNGSILYNKENLWETSAGGGYTTYAWMPHWAWDGGYSAPITLNEWHSSVVVYDKVKQKMYQDGELKYSRNQTGNLGTNSSYLQIGARGDRGHSSFFVGDIDEMRVSMIDRSYAWLSASYASDMALFASFTDNESFIYENGYLISNVFDTGYPSEWSNIQYLNTTGESTVEVKVRSDIDEAMIGASEWSLCDTILSGSDISDNNCVDDDDRYIQYRIDVSDTTDEFSFEEISLSFSPSDQTPPITNADNVYMGNSVLNNAWINFEPTIIWNAGEDNIDGNGILGYCISIDEVSVAEESQSLDPEITSGILEGFDDGVSTDGCPYVISDTSIDLSTISNLDLVSNKKYYFSIKAVDYAGNVWSGNSSQYQDLAWFRYDDTRPENVMYISTPTTDFGSVNDMFFNWPITGSSQANDGESGLLGWQYAVNSTASEDWIGTELSATLGIQYIPFDGGIRSVNLDSDTNGSDIVIGNNTIYFRSIDNAGNVSTYVTGGLNYGGAAPEFPAEAVVSVSPQSSESNMFALSWPEAVASDDNEIDSYYYMINTQPPSSISTLRNNNHVYIPTESLQIPSGKITGAVKGTNNVYVVAVDSGNNYSPTKAIHGTFELNSTLPDAPQALSTADLSIKGTELWRVALTWEVPIYKGNGDLTYIIVRSEDGITWSEVARTTGLSYTDIVPESKTYYYKVASVDTSNESLNSPTYSTIVELFPKGRYEEPAELISNALVSGVTTRYAQINWVTDRISDSKVQLGVESNVYFQDEMYRSDMVTDHEIELTNLQPGTQYYYRIKWTDEDGNTGISDESIFQTKPAPIVEDIVIDSVGLNYAILKLTTSGATKAQVVYGKTKTYGASQVINTSTVSSEYSIMLTDLEDGTDYHYKIILTDEEGFEYESFEDHMFVTPPRPQVSNIEIQEKKGVPTPTVDVFWESNIEVNSIVKYTHNNKALDKVDMDLIKGEHSMEINNLEPDSDYQLVIEGVDAMGNRAVSDVYTFTTATDTRPPQVFSIKSEGDVQSSDVQADRTRSAQLVISWETDEPSTSQVLYGEGAGGDGYPFSTQTDSEMRYKHVIVVSNLAPSKVYHFKVISKDIAGNVGESGSVTAITPKSTDTVIESVLGSLSRIFGFL